LILSKAYWISPDGNIIDIGLQTHIAYIISHPAIFNTTLEKITKLYKKYNEVMPVEGIARHKIIMVLLKQNFIRIRQYKNHWSISLIILDDDTKSRLSQWSEIAMTITNSGQYADVIIQTYDGKKHHYSVQDLYSQSY